jgi:hypothetical protein
LINDTRDSDTKKMIGKEPLSKVLNRIDDELVREGAKRAAWLGNDETHYQREYPNNGLSNFKKLIDVVIRYIENKKHIATMIEEMPHNKDLSKKNTSV